MHGSEVWEQYLAGNIAGIRDYCETDVLNTYLIYLRFELIRGHLAHAAWESEVARVRVLLAQETKPHLQAFLAAWQ
jgi:predicted PolB exonuclease-like 3'-5' exonuclease